MTNARMATVAELAEVRRRYSERRRLPIYVPGWYEQDIPTLLRHIAYLHGLLAEKRGQDDDQEGPWATRFVVPKCGHEIGWGDTDPPEQCLECRIDALLTEHGGREGE